MKNKFMFLKTSEAILEKIFDELNQVESFNMTSFDPSKTALIMIDMVNGFCASGALYSPRIESLISEVVKLSYKCEELKIKKVAFADSHQKNSIEFEAYPSHCVKGTKEADIVEELEVVGGYELIEKNSTNGFLEPKFLKWLNENKDIDHFIVVGDCTDICILQFSLTLKTYFNRQDKSSRIVVPMNAVNTYDLGMHNGDLMQYISLYQMMITGIEIVKEITI